MNGVVVIDDKAFKDASFGKLGMWFFLIMDGLSFVAILIAAAYLRTNGAPWPAADGVQYVCPAFKQLYHDERF